MHDIEDRYKKKNFPFDHEENEEEGNNI